LNSKFVQNVHKYRMGWHAEPSSTKIFEDNSFIHTWL
jgi:hypothetical protein